jgi:ABC-type lipoprotein release transport system permease subunit
MMGLVLRSLRHYWRTNLGVVLGALLASGVLTGALLVGDSVDYSLQRAAVLRLGSIHFAADLRNQFAQQSLVSALAEHAGGTVTGALRVRGMAIFQGERAEDREQINRVEVLGVAPDFFAFADQDPELDLAADEVAINTKLAKALGVAAGDSLSLRVNKPSLMARDAPLSWRNDEGTRRGRFTVKRVLGDEELGRFSLSANQTVPYNAFVNLEWLQNEVDLAERVNLVLAGEVGTAGGLEAALRTVWRPEHLGLDVRADAGVVQLESDRVFLGAETARAAYTVQGAQGTYTYLVNSIAKDSANTPYSFVVAGPAREGMGDDGIVLNRWAADTLGAAVGDDVTVTYAELQANNDFVDRTRTFTVHSIREMNELAAERDLMPVYPGLTDVESCSEWDVGMPMDDALLADEANEAYWDAYGQTPKAWVTLAAGQDMWANRFGDLTAVRYPGDAARAEEVRAALMQEMDPALMGLYFQPARDQATRAVAQAMDFGGLFIGMSFFLIVAALLLTGLLFVFGVQQRASEMGLLLALGYRPGQIRLLFLVEGFVLAAAGAVFGAAVSVGYTRALLYGLSQYWQDAVAGTSILYHGTTGTLAMGAGIGLVCALGSMAIALWRQAKRPARELLHMDFTQDQSTAKVTRFPKFTFGVAAGGLLLALGLIGFAAVSQNMSATGAFFGAGALLLIAGLSFCRLVLIRCNRAGASECFSLSSLAVQNVARRQGRSLAVVAMLACGCFLVIAVSSMQEDLRKHAHERRSGTGGFALFATATFPVLDDPLASLDMPGVSGTALKVRDGDEASCLNLNHVEAPPLLGVDVASLVERGAFAAEDAESLWPLLEVEREDGAIPALVGDANTAMWTLKKKTGVERGDVLEYADEFGNVTKLKLVGALPMRLSVFQGTVLVSKEAFTEMFPSEAGHRMFLVDTPTGQADAVAAELRRTFDRSGMDAVPAVERLLEFYAVESTYLAMFLVLGGLGLLLGSAGMGVVVLRNLLERRGELAMLQALGFSSGVLRRVLSTEYGLLLAAGLVVGGVAAAVATVPAVLATESSVAIGVQVRLVAGILVLGAGCMLAAVALGLRGIDFGALRNE